MVNKNAMAILGLLFVVGLVIYSQTGGQLFNISGFSTLSLQQVDFLSNDPTVGGKAWLLTVVMNGQGQSAVGSFTKDQIVDSFDKVSAANDLGINTVLEKNEIVYPIQAQNQYFYKLEYAKLDYFYASQQQVTNFQNECYSNNGVIYSQTFSQIKFCVKKVLDARYGAILSGTQVFSAKITTTSAGKSETTTISNIGQT